MGAESDGAAPRRLRRAGTAARKKPLPVASATIGQAGISAAVAWHFTRAMFPEMLSDSAYPALHRFSAQAESLAEFQAAPHGAGTYVQP